MELPTTKEGRGHFTTAGDRGHLAVRSWKKPLSIQIPRDAEFSHLTPGLKVKSGSNYADSNEDGTFYGVTLKKGFYRRTNEDRVGCPC